MGDIMGRAVGGRVDGVRGLRAPCHLRHIVTEHIIDDGKKNEGENFKVKTAHNMWRGLLNERRNKFSKSSNQISEDEGERDRAARALARAPPSGLPLSSLCTSSMPI